MPERRLWRQLRTATLVTLLVASFAAPAGAAGPDVLAGVYRTRSLQLRMDGTEYMAENILEIVTLSPATAYVRIRIEGSNGHECNLFGVADLDRGGLLYRSAAPLLNGEPPCRLTIHPDGDRLVLGDIEDGCRSLCGVRASFGDGVFPRRTRRPIRYLDRLLRSTEFRQALAEHDHRPAAGVP